MKRIFKSIPNYENTYKISNYGEILRTKSYDSRNHLRKERLRKSRITSDGYCQIGLYSDGIETKYLIHKLVAEIFLDKKHFKYMPDENPNKIDLNSLEVNHKDEDKINNRVDNLEWCSHKYNTNYGTMQERRLKAWRKSRKEDIYA